MSEAAISVHMPDALLRDASAQADRRGLSLEQWLIDLAAERVRTEQISDRFFRDAAGRTPEENRRLLTEVLDQAPDVPPIPGDELPE